MKERKDRYGKLNRGDKEDLYALKISCKGKRTVGKSNKGVIGFKKLKLKKKEKKGGKKGGRMKKEKKENSAELQKPNREEEVYSNNNECN